MPAVRARSFPESVAMADSGSLAGASVDYSDVFDEAEADTGATRRHGGDDAASASEVDYDDDDGVGARSVLRGMDELDSMQVEEEGAGGGATATGMTSESIVGGSAHRSASASGSAALELQVRLRG